MHSKHRRASSSGQDSEVHLRLKDKVHSFEDNKVHIMEREDNLFKQGLKKVFILMLMLFD